MNHIHLITVKRVREIEGDAHGFARPHQHGVFPAEIAGGKPLIVDREFFLLLGAANALEYLKLEAVDVKRMWHAGLRVLNVPHFSRAALNGDRRFFVLIGLAVDTPHHLHVVEDDHAR